MNNKLTSKIMLVAAVFAFILSAIGFAPGAGLALLVSLWCALIIAGTKMSNIYRRYRARG
ncbi:hypothetical protein [Arcanobacterium bovis]|uniref:Uncharacterized protein n=1 Tax=Arcanobacterium bovis TaxID=2529275 RepID=A0A4Q9V0G5_9ACTO|nr:hypothetical protein [Arcanobacterium bovis]TBW20836.1 hypothetical protein EZJ44_07875 [Arcanobacterium bovis]